MSLTEIKVRQAHCKDKIYFLSDEDGLSLKIEPNGRKSGAIAIQTQNKKTSAYSIGVLSRFIFKKARQIRDDFRDNNFVLKMLFQIITFRKVGDEWLQFKLKNAFNDLPRCGVLELAEKCLQNDIYPELQEIPFQKLNVMTWFR
jgi:hypothetical protein